MRKGIWIVMALAGLLAAAVLPADVEAYRGGGAVYYGYGGPAVRGGVWAGSGWGGWGGWGASWGPGWGWWGASYPYYYYPAPPVVIEQPAQFYVQPNPQPDVQSYWFYCEKPAGYYPYVKRCPPGWMKVLPSPMPPDDGDGYSGPPSPMPRTSPK